ncbi:cobalt transporter CbiM [Halanaerobium salsuginis]|jgi:cobalt/nickel transport system permease protein|uniref:Cobalt/nickel transport system permease protein n=1 Tax=Halanaerobium salsuginis TaxID=29563 RepID=A0A1I4K4N7_9FIRM|nr:cobalt transporter CbiM [Halanaerobium salsuginis]SFL73748.1 cobalt/nickel transport system permease protein [Halanaerobium salsuginis]
MHISEGVLAAPVLITGAAVTAAGVAIGLKKMDEADIPKTALVAAVLFVASLIHVPLGPTSVHLILNGLAGILLGWEVFPAFLVALFLQSILFQFGGLTTLGVNTLNVGLPAVLVYYLFNFLQLRKNSFLETVLAFASGGLAVFLTALMVAASLMFTDQSFQEIAKITILAHLPVIIIEAVITAVIISFIKKVKPEVLAGGENNE